MNKSNKTKIEKTARVLKELKGNFNYLLLTTKNILDFIVSLNNFKSGSIINFYKAWSKFFDAFLFRIEKQGPKSAVKHFKEIYNISVRIALKQSFTPIGFTKSTKSGIPFIILDFLPLLQGSKWEIRFALTALRIYTLITLPVEEDFSNITRKVNESDERTNILSQFIDFIKSHPLEQIKYKDNVETNINASVHSGPNGPAVMTAHYDALALKQEGLSDKLIEFMTFVKADFLPTFKSCLENTSPEDCKSEVQSARISLIPETGGKTRIIAILDFWTQRLLRPIHLGLMLKLRELDMDGTFDQNMAFRRALNFSKDHPTYSFDLSAATDRFPVAPQVALLETMFGSEIAGFWYQLLVNRDYWFTKKSFGKRIKLQSVRWSVGQPLGAYSSWAAFSLTHHYFIQFCHYQNLNTKQRQKYRIMSFKDYTILGDDVTIWNSNVSSNYQDFLGKMDVPINMNKSITTTITGINVGEFCKRIFMNGTELSPISLNAILSVKDSLYNLPNLIEHLTTRWNIPSSILETWVKETKIFTKKEYLLDIIFGFRQMVNGFTAFPWCLYDREAALTGLRSHIIAQASLGLSFFTNKPNGFDPDNPFKGVIKKVSQLGQVLQKHGIGFSNTLLPDKPFSAQVKSRMRLFHPIVEAYQDVCSGIFEQNFDRALGYRPALKDEHKIQIDYFKRVRTASVDLFFLKTKRRHLKLHTAIAIRWFFQYQLVNQGGIDPYQSLKIKTNYLDTKMTLRDSLVLTGRIS